MLSKHDLVPPEGQIIHALWTLHFLKQYPKQDAGCPAVGRSRGAVDPKTFCKYVHPFIYAIASLEIYVVSIFIFSSSSCSIVFLISNQILQNIFSGILFLQILLNNHFKGDVCNDCLMSIDGTDFQIQEKGKKFYSFKFKKSALRYEVALCILTGDICWISSPYAPGIWNNLDVFHFLWQHFLSHLNMSRQMMGALVKLPSKLSAQRALPS